MTEASKEPQPQKRKKQQPRRIDFETLTPEEKLFVRMSYVVQVSADAIYMDECTARETLQRAVLSQHCYEVASGLHTAYQRHMHWLHTLREFEYREGIGRASLEQRRAQKLERLATQEKNECASIVAEIQDRVFEHRKERRRLGLDEDAARQRITATEFHEFRVWNNEHEEALALYRCSVAARRRQRAADVQREKRDVILHTKRAAATKRHKSFFQWKTSKAATRQVGGSASEVYLARLLHPSLHPSAFSTARPVRLPPLVSRSSQKEQKDKTPSQVRAHSGTPSLAALSPIHPPQP